MRAADADKKRGVAKSILAISVVVALAGVLAVWFFTRRGTHKDDIVVARDPVGTIDVNGDIKGKKGKGSGGGRGGSGGGGPATRVAGRASTTSSTATTRRSPWAAPTDTPDLTDAQLSAPLRHASFISGCGAPDDMHVTVRVAVKMGRAVGVTVSTNPPSGGVAACIDGAVRGCSGRRARRPTSSRRTTEIGRRARARSTCACTIHEP